MNQEFNDMERMFQEGLQNYEVTPPAHVWNNIQKQKRRGLLFYRFKIASIILLLCLTGAGTYYFMNTTYNQETNVINTFENKELDNKNNEVSVETINKSIKSNTNDIIASTSKSKLVLKGNKTQIYKHNSKSITKKDIATDLKDNSNPISADDLSMTMDYKNEIKLKYQIYPSLMQYVYSTKRIPKKYLTPKKEKESEKLGYKYSIEMVGGPSYAYRKLSGQGSQLRDESEQANLTVQTGLKLNYHINPTWSIQSGLSWESRNEKVKYNQTELQRKLTQTPHQVTVFHPVLPPRSITVIDSTYSNENVNFKFNNANKYTTINIPVVLGYTFTLGKLQYRVSAGSLFNIYSINSANNLVRNGNTIDLVKYKESPKIKTSIYTAVALQYPLNTNCMAITELSYYTNVTNRMSADTLLRQRNYGLNLSVGAKISLRK